MSRIAPYPLRMTPEMRERLEKQANENHRSLQQEIIYQLDTMYHIDAVLDSASLKGDSYSRVMTLLKEYKLASQLAGEVERLKHQLSLLSNSVTTPESNKFMEIETQANIIKESVDKILKQIPFRVSGISKKK